MDQIKKAIECIKKGELIIYPTETAYGLGCDPKNKKAVEKLKKLKKREKPLPLICSNLKQIEEFGILNSTALKLVKKFMPGPLSLIIEKKDKYNYLSKEGISFRISSNPIAFELCQRLNSALVATSANLKGEPTLYNISKVKKQFQKVCFIIDGGNLKKVPVSTIYDTRQNKIIRKGSISKEQILSARK